MATMLFFLVIKPVNSLLSRLRREPPVVEKTRPLPRVPQRIPIAARRCAFCTMDVAAA